MSAATLRILSRSPGRKRPTVIHWRSVVYTRSLVGAGACLWGGGSAHGAIVSTTNASIAGHQAVHIVCGGVGAHQHHVVEGRDHQAPVQQVEVNVLLQRRVQDAVRLAAVARRSGGELELGSRAHLRYAPAQMPCRAIMARSPSAKRVASVNMWA